MRLWWFQIGFPHDYIFEFIFIGGAVCDVSIFDIDVKGGEVMQVDKVKQEVVLRLVQGFHQCQRGRLLENMIVTIEVVDVVINGN